MGLDMYLYKMKKHGKANMNDALAVDHWLSLVEYKKEHPEYKKGMMEWCGMKKPSTSVIKFYQDQPPIEVAYWRKANQVHRWFVENVQNGEDDCGYYPVTKEQLIELRDLCRDVLENRDLAELRLPTCAGFFFGSMNYDQWYFSDLEQTVEQITNILDSTDFDSEAIYYGSSW